MTLAGWLTGWLDGWPLAGGSLRLLLHLAGTNPEKASEQASKAGRLAARDWVWQKAGHTYIRDQRSALPVTA